MTDVFDTCKAMLAVSGTLAGCLLWWLLIDSLWAMRQRLAKEQVRLDEMRRRHDEMYIRIQAETDRRTP